MKLLKNNKKNKRIKKKMALTAVLCAVSLLINSISIYAMALSDNAGKRADAVILKAVPILAISEKDIPHDTDTSNNLIHVSETHAYEMQTTAVKEKILIKNDNRRLNKKEDTENKIDAPYYNLTKPEYDALCKMVYAEAHIEGLKGQEMVAEVILNRVDNEAFPNDVISVISQEGQFQPYRNGAYHSSVPDEETMEAVNIALTGKDTTYGALYFKSVSSSQKWNKKVTAKHKHHVFYL